MRLATVFEYLDQAGELGEGWGSVVLVRNTAEPPDSARAYDMVPVVDVTEDDVAEEIELVTSGVEAGPAAPVPELCAVDLAAALRRLGDVRGDYALFSAHPVPEDAPATENLLARAPIVGIAADADVRALLFVEWFADFERELGGGDA